MSTDRKAPHQAAPLLLACIACCCGLLLLPGQAAGQTLDLSTDTIRVFGVSECAMTRPSARTPATERCLHF
jgi:hypothetical protein